MIVFKSMFPEWHPLSVATANFMTTMYNVDYDAFDQVRGQYSISVSRSDGGYYLRTDKESHYDCF